MHVVIFSHGGGSPYHGPNMRWYYLGQALHDLGCKVTIVSSSYFHKYNRMPEVSEGVSHEVIDGIEYVWVKTKPYRSRFFQIYNQVEFSFKAYRYATSDFFPKGADIVVASSPHPFVIYAANRLAHQLKKPLVYEVRDLWPLVVRDLSGAPAWHPYMLLLKMTEWFAVRKADIVASVKPGDKEYFMENYSFSEDRFFYAPNGFYDGGEKKLGCLGSAEGARAGLGLKKASFVVGYVGALSTYYGIQELIEAARLLHNDSEIMFRIVGGGEDLEKIRDLVRSYKLENVELAGPVAKSKVEEELAGFDVCYVGLKDVSANRYGISCNKLFEYMHAGKPIVASYSTDHDPVKFAQCGITVMPGDSSGIADAISFLKSNPELCRQFGECGAKYFWGNHEFSVVAKKYHDLFLSFNGS
ncbi:glycosyltransferase family 4 protein [Chromohalobacter israelensis]|uniref:glycosyltransferase family 4 protein n=1 Tax=Chromohalobacter israelensis TaxID=141390 RepID=UPI0013E8BCA0|nr:glycosyltransferase family 4 protein [Chromohalobacter salexigens]